LQRASLIRAPRLSRAAVSGEWLISGKRHTISNNLARAAHDLRHRLSWQLSANAPPRRQPCGWHPSCPRKWCEPKKILQWRTDMLKRFTVMTMLAALLSLAVAPETFAHCRRHARVVAYRSAYYGNSYYRTGYYGRPYYRTVYYRRPYYRTAYYGSPYRYSGVAGTRYYAARRGHSTRRMLLTIGAPAALGAGLGALFGGGKGAGVGALLGGGGGAAYYLLRHRRRY
jgi:hypothetical protein